MEKGTYKPFDDKAWFDRQVHSRTRAALDARQLELFRAERAEVKRRKQEKYLARLEKKMTAGQIGV